MRSRDSAELVHVGPGTVMSEFMRQHWLPALMSRELLAAGAIEPGGPAERATTGVVHSPVSCARSTSRRRCSRAGLEAERR